MLLSPPATGADAVLADCAAIEERGSRLKCYDDIANPAPMPPSAKGEAPLEPAPAPQIILPPPEPYLTETWNLGVTDRNLDITNIRPHRPTYILLSRWTDNVNQTPGSPAPGHTATTPLDIDDQELKFQLSFKSELVSRETFEKFGLNHLRFWFAYTQQSHWQIFNSRNSRPFRETNYEPELILTYSTGNASGLKLVNLGGVHQSNGGSLPGSRSWNRFYLQGGWEWGRYSVLARGWASSGTDDNPDINDYIGRAEVIARWDSEARSQMLSLLLRHNLKVEPSRGFVQFDWRPIRLSKTTGVHLQVTSGYGESLTDYNHNQTTVGIGVSFVDWK
jgi:phospholipase A1